jgi:LPXTG-site transpeptidase (sortase) family protein
MKSIKRNKILFWFLGSWIIFTLLLVFLFWPIIYSELSYTLKDKNESNVINISEELSKEPQKLDVPNKIVISKINVDAPIVEAESVEEKDILDALVQGIAHYPNTPLPGEVGNVFVTGHSSNYLWAEGKYNYVFSLLNKLEAGDDIVVYYDGIKYVYRIFNVSVVSPKDVSVMNQANDSVISLMTCDPVGTNWKRRVVKARQLVPDPKNNKSPEYSPIIIDELVGN